MKAKFSISATLRPGAKHGVDQHRTPMLLITKFQGMAMGDDISRVAKKPPVAQSLKSSNFKGHLGEHITIALDDNGSPERVLFVGMGKAQSFDCSTIREIMTLSVKQAIAQGCTRLSIPILPNRLSANRLPLKGTIHILKTIAHKVLEEEPGNNELLIEFVCTPQAKRHVSAGLECRKKSDCGACT